MRLSLSVYPRWLQRANPKPFPFLAPRSRPSFSPPTSDSPDMPRFHLHRKRIRTPDPRLLSDGRCRSPSPEAATIAQIVIMFSMDDPLLMRVLLSFSSTSSRRWDYLTISFSTRLTWSKLRYLFQRTLILLNVCSVNPS